MYDPIYLCEPHVVTVDDEACGLSVGMLVVPVKYLPTLDVYLCRAYTDFGGDAGLRNICYYVDNTALAYLDGFFYDNYLET